VEPDRSGLEQRFFARHPAFPEGDGIITEQDRVFGHESYEHDHADEAEDLDYRIRLSETPD
jgi:hypothetical protein